MSKKQLLIAICLLTAATIKAVDTPYLFRVTLRDKAPTPHQIDHPSDFLSERALERRTKRNIPIDSTDLPIAQPYIDAIESAGARVVVRNKWLNSVVVALSDSSDIKEIELQPMVTSSYCVQYPTESKTVAISKFKAPITHTNQTTTTTQRTMLQADLLHEIGYKGSGMQIAVIDAGFWNVDTHVGIDQRHIIGTKDFVYPPSSDIYREFHHGMNVLSIMLSQSEKYVGTAPEAHYYLLRSEIKEKEWPVEQDYWIAAAEYADSIGVDLINSSLGYGLYDEPHYNIDKEDLDGKTTWISKGATIAASKGILVVNSAGNEGYTQWYNLLSPADVPALLTVGSVNSDMQVSSFSSRGYKLPKPDVMAMGEETLIMDEKGALYHSNGTSFAAPLISGMMACLWQALPHLSAQRLIQCVREGSNRATQPDLDYGYGVPSFYDIYIKYKDSSTSSIGSDKPLYSCYSHDGKLFIDGLVNGDHIEIITTSGQIVHSTHFNDGKNSTLATPISDKGFYLIHISSRAADHTLKAIL